jgi:hypothetical protein
MTKKLRDLYKPENPVPKQAGEMTLEMHQKIKAEKRKQKKK